MYNISAATINRILSYGWVGNIASAIEFGFIDVRKINAIPIQFFVLRVQHEQTIFFQKIYSLKSKVYVESIRTVQNETHQMEKHFKYMLYKLCNHTYLPIINIFFWITRGG